jgi:hypothetical protein
MECFKKDQNAETLAPRLVVSSFVKNRFSQLSFWRSGSLLASLAHIQFHVEANQALFFHKKKSSKKIFQLLPHKVFFSPIEASNWQLFTTLCVLFPWLLLS